MRSQTVPLFLEKELAKRFLQHAVRLAAFGTLMAVAAAAEARFNAEAIRLNNRGVALMGQQFTEKAQEAFAESFQKDPKLAQAAINEGIALLTLQKVDEGKKALNEAIALDRNNPQAW